MPLSKPIHTHIYHSVTLPVGQEQTQGLIQRRFSKEEPRDSASSMYYGGRRYCLFNYNLGIGFMTKNIPQYPVLVWESINIIMDFEI